MDRTGQREALEEVIRRLEAARSELEAAGAGRSFDDARVESHIKTAISATRAALAAAREGRDEPTPL